MDNVKFARNLVKGKIAETIFAQMLRETREFTVLEFGYEKVIPGLVQRGYPEDSGTIETLRTAPDFAVINHKTKEVRLIEVKYMRALITDYVLKSAQRMSESWNPSYLFIATLDAFYFDEINNRHWPHFIDFEIKKKYFKKIELPFGKQGEFSEAFSNSFNYGGGTPYPFSRAQYETLKDKLFKLVEGNK